MGRVIFLALIASLLPFVSSAKNHAIYMGGGDPSDPKDSLFITNMRVFNVAFSDAEKKVYTSQLKNLSRQERSQVQGTFTSTTFKNSIAELIKKINSNQLTKADQLILVIDTHSGGYDSPAGLGFFTTEKIDPAALNELQKAADKKGVPLALVGLTCGSGELIALGSSNTCVISLASPDGEAHSQDSLRVLENMALSKNLEDAYLKSRLGGFITPLVAADGRLATVENLFAPPAQPMISTEAGKNSFEILAALGTNIRGTQYSLPKIYNLQCSDYSGSLTKLKLDINSIQTDLSKKDPVIRSALANLTTLVKTYEATMLKLERQSWKIKSSENLPISEEEKKKITTLIEKIAAQERLIYSRLYTEFTKSSNTPNPCRKFKLNQ